MIHLYSINGNSLEDQGRTIDVKSPITDMAYSDDGAHLVVLTERKAVILYSAVDNYEVNT